MERSWRGHGEVMNVVFLEPAFPANQRAFVLALAQVGATVIGIGERPADWLDDELKGAMAHYQQVHSVVDEGALLDAVRQIQGAVWVDRLEATIEAHIMAAAHVREACTIPGTSSRTAFLCRDKPAMKEVLREAGVPCAQSTGASSAAEVEEFVAAVGFPVILKPRDAAGASGTHRADDRRAAGGAQSQATGVDRGAGSRSRSSSRATRASTTRSRSTGRWCTSSSPTTTPTCSRRCATRWISPQFIATNRVDEAGCTTRSRRSAARSSRRSASARRRRTWSGSSGPRA